jgi:hypothetical protein
MNCWDSLECMIKVQDKADFWLHVWFVIWVILLLLWLIVGVRIKKLEILEKKHAISRPWSKKTKDR